MFDSSPPPDFNHTKTEPNDGTDSLENFKTVYEPWMNDGSIAPYVDFEVPAPSFHEFKKAPSEHLLVGPFTDSNKSRNLSVSEQSESYARWAPVSRRDRAAIAETVKHLEHSRKDDELALITAYLNLLAGRPDGSAQARTFLKQEWSEQSDMTFCRDGLGDAVAAGLLINFDLDEELRGRHYIVLRNGATFYSHQKYKGKTALNFYLTQWEAFKMKEADERLLALGKEDQETIRDAAMNDYFALTWLSILATRKGGSKAAMEYLERGPDDGEIVFSIDKGGESPASSSTSGSLKEPQQKR